MPRKRTRSLRRVDVRSGAEAWQDYFEFGFAMFDDFGRDTGVEPGQDHRVPREAALHAWRCYGVAFLALFGRAGDKGDPHWALTEFGEPAHAR